MTDRIVRATHALPGWACGKCNKYNGAQRDECSACGKPFDASDDVKRELRRACLRELEGVHPDEKKRDDVRACAARLAEQAGDPIPDWAKGADVSIPDGVMMRMHSGMGCPFCSGVIGFTDVGLTHTIPTCTEWKNEPDPVAFLRMLRKKMHPEQFS